MNQKSNIWCSRYLIMGILIVLTHACKKEPSTKELLTTVKWQVTDFCGPVGDPYTWTFNPNGQFVEENTQGLSYSTWSLKNNDKVLVIGLGEENIIALTKTELQLKGNDLFSCTYVFKAIPL